MNELNVMARTAHQNFNDTVSLKRSLNGGFLEIGRLLKENKDNRFYEVLGHETFESYISSPELSMSRSAVYTLIQIYEKLVLKLNIPAEELMDTDWTKLQKILPSINEDNKQDLLSKAKVLSRSDLAIVVSDEPEQEYCKCPTCGGSGRVKRE